ncbi:hypothetical protein AVEN_199365-1, partial [Araneus ventricosus]
CLIFGSSLVRSTSIAFIEAFKESFPFDYSQKYINVLSFWEESRKSHLQSLLVLFGKRGLSKAQFHQVPIVFPGGTDEISENNNDQKQISPCLQHLHFRKLL